MPTTDAQRRANKKYDQVHMTWMSIGLHKTNDADIIEGLAGLENRSAFIKNAIRKAMSNGL